MTKIMILKSLRYTQNYVKKRFLHSKDFIFAQCVSSFFPTYQG